MLFFFLLKILVTCAEHHNMASRRGGPRRLPGPTHQQQVIEEEHLPLVHARPLLLVHIIHLVQAAVANQAAVGEGQVLGSGGNAMFLESRKTTTVADEARTVNGT